MKKILKKVRADLEEGYFSYPGKSSLRLNASMLKHAGKILSVTKLNMTLPAHQRAAEEGYQYFDGTYFWVDEWFVEEHNTLEDYTTIVNHLLESGYDPELLAVAILERIRAGSKG